MTVNETLAEFATTLDRMIESALSCVGNPDAFLAANREIETIMEQQWPAIAETLTAAALSEADRAVLESMSVALGALEAQASARLVWTSDFEDYMRDALTQR